MPDRFTRRVVAVTGGGSGIGAATVRRFAREGASVGILDVDAARAEAIAAELRATGRAAVAVATDVSQAASVEAAFAAVERELGPLDVLVNDAGITRPAPFAELTDAAWDAVLAVNLRGSYLCARGAAARFRERRAGRIVNLSSMAILAGPLGRVNYTTSKSGVVGLTRALALELGPFGITVNAIAPGFIDTPMTAAAQSPERRQRVLDITPLRRLGAPDDVAAAIAFLASDDASFITGQVLFVCGGRSILGDAR